MRRDDVSKRAYLTNDLEVDVLHCTSSLGFLVNFVAHVADVFVVVVLGGKITSSIFQLKLAFGMTFSNCDEISFLFYY